MIIKNAKVYSDGCRFVEKDLIIRDGRIVFGAAPQEGEDVIDAGGAYALPGPRRGCFLTLEKMIFVLVLRNFFTNSTMMLAPVASTTGT